ncbi:hypothetical protein [Gemmatimonas sp.]|uniref:hypothetical protein n=1 Tax=Gemmatimonas sp. TaxID=1962908 RepID=UPI0037C075A0
MLTRSRPASLRAIACVTGAALALAACASATPPVATATQPVRMAPSDSAPAAPADGLSAAFHEQFAEADTRARTITYWMQCVGTVARLRAGGTFGRAAAAPRAIYCTRTGDGVPVGGVYDIDSAYRKITRLQMVRLDGTRPRYTEGLDTLRIAREARAVREVNRRLTVAWTKRNRPFSAVAVPRADGTVEAWVIPRTNKARSIVTGGDMGFLLTSGDSLQLLADRSATWTQLNLAATGPLRLYSSTRDVPAVADLVSARYHTELGRDVTVSTPLAVSTLVPGLDPATGARVVWKHTRAAP